MENNKIIEMREKIDAANKSHGKVISGIYKEFGATFGGYVSLDQNDDREAYDLEGLEVGDFITVYESGEDGVDAIITFVDEDDADYTEWELLSNVKAL